MPSVAVVMMVCRMIRYYYYYFSLLGFNCIVQNPVSYNMDIGTMWHCVLVSCTPSQSLGQVWWYAVLVLGVIMCSFYQFFYRELFRHDYYDYYWSFITDVIKQQAIIYLITLFPHSPFIFRWLLTSCLWYINTQGDIITKWEPLYWLQSSCLCHERSSQLPTNHSDGILNTCVQYGDVFQGR